MEVSLAKQPSAQAHEAERLHNETLRVQGANWELQPLGAQFLVQVPLKILNPTPWEQTFGSGSAEVLTHAPES